MVEPYSIEDVDEIEDMFTDYCKDKGYQVKVSEEQHSRRLDISNLSETTIIKIFKTGKILVQGRQNTLMGEMDALKEKVTYITEGDESNERTVTYTIILPELRQKIRNSLNELGEMKKIIDNPNSKEEYRAKISRIRSEVTIIQYNSGTLLLQGKTNKLFEESCDHIEKISKSNEQEIASRFLKDDGHKKELNSKITTDILKSAEINTKHKLGDACIYIELHDKKLFIASECLRLANIPLPEYSPIVMPASKAFEGFTKKLIVDIGLVERDDVEKKRGFNFNILVDNRDERKAICDKDKYMDKILRRLSTDIYTIRHFMMHSDNSPLCVIDNYDDASFKVDAIYSETKLIFNYFNSIFTLISD